MHAHNSLFSTVGISFHSTPIQSIPSYCIYLEKHMPIRFALFSIAILETPRETTKEAGREREASIQVGHQGYESPLITTS